MATSGFLGNTVCSNWLDFEQDHGAWLATQRTTGGD